MEEKGFKSPQNNFGNQVDIREFIEMEINHYNKQYICGYGLTCKVERTSVLETV